MKLTRVLKEGTAGNDVKHLQSKLEDLKFYTYGTLTGNFGKVTKQAVKDFQTANKLLSDGIVGRITWNRLMEGDVKVNTSKPVASKPTTSKPGVKFGYKPSLVTAEGLEIYDEILPDNEYVKQETKKEVIYLHHTAGGSRPDWTIKSWGRDGKNNKPYRIATSYVMGRRASSNGDDAFDGKTFRCFDDKYWAYHLGVKGNSAANKNSIGIEVCNYGYCRVVDGKFINYVNREIPADEVVDLGKEFRGYRYWERYTDEQIESLRKLLVYLIDKHDIDFERGIYDWDWFDYDPEKLKGSGIRTHVQVRNDKTDMFPQQELIDMLNSL